MNGFLTNALWFYLIIVNLYVFALMGYDKFQAKRGGWRIPEANLIFMGVVGGGLGGLLGMQMFHHKTRKLRFKIGFSVGLLVDAILIFIYGL